MLILGKICTCAVAREVTMATYIEFQNTKFENVVQVPTVIFENDIMYPPSLEIPVFFPSL